MFGQLTLSIDSSTHLPDNRRRRRQAGRRSTFPSHASEGAVIHTRLRYRYTRPWARTDPPPGMRLPSRTITIRLLITPLTRTLIQKSPNFRTSQNIANTDQLDLLGWNNQRRGQKRVVRLLPREIVRYTRGVEKFFPAKRRRRKFIVHRGRIKHAVPAVSSAGSTARRPDIIYSVARSDREANTRISRISGGGVAGGRGGREGRLSPDGREGNKAATRPYI